MIRNLLSLGLVGVLCVALGAQGTTGITPSQKSELFKKNRPVIERLVDKTVESSTQPADPLMRADTYYKVLVDFSKEITTARAAGDKDRVEELTAHLKQLLDEGLAPTLGRARKQVADGSHKDDYERVRDDLLAQVGALLDLMDDQPTAKKSLEDTRANLKSIVGPKK
jgi:hypothetical protein